MHAKVNKEEILTFHISYNDYLKFDKTQAPYCIKMNNTKAAV